MLSQYWPQPVAWLYASFVHHRIPVRRGDVTSLPVNVTCANERMSCGFLGYVNRVNVSSDDDVYVIRMLRPLRLRTWRRSPRRCWRITNTRWTGSEDRSTTSESTRSTTSFVRSTRSSRGKKRKKKLSKWSKSPRWRPCHGSSRRRRPPT